MTAYKRQHYLPVVYLREFAVDSTLPRPKLRIWRFDGTQSQNVSVEGQCSGNYFYSRENAEPVEKMFGGMERFYAESLATIRRDQALPPSDLYGLILAMGDFHARNAAYVNKTGKDNHHAYQLQAGALMGALTGNLKGNISQDAIVNHLIARWTAYLLPCDGENTPLIASDNPVVCFASGKRSPRLSLLLMPIAPDCLAVAFDHRIHRITREFLTVEDVGELYHLQCRCALRCVYSWKQLSPQHEEGVRAIFSDNPDRHRGVTSNGVVSLPTLKFLEDRKLSFLAPSAIRL